MGQNQMQQFNTKYHVVVNNCNCIRIKWKEKTWADIFNLEIETQTNVIDGRADERDNCSNWILFIYLFSLFLRLCNIKRWHWLFTLYCLCFVKKFRNISLKIYQPKAILISPFLFHHFIRILRARSFLFRLALWRCRNIQIKIQRMNKRNVTKLNHSIQKPNDPSAFT